MPTGTLHADDVRARERGQRLRVILWWLPSILLHLLFVGVVGYFGYQKLVEERGPDPEKPPEDLPEEVYEQLADTIESVRFNELLRQLTDLQIILHNMDVLKNEFSKTFDEFAAAEANAAVEEDLIRQLFDRTLILQDAVLIDQAALAEAARPLAETMRSAESDPESTGEALKTALDGTFHPAEDRIRINQADAQNVLDRIANEARLVGLPQTAAKTEEVRELQLQANRKESETASNLSGAVWNLSRFPEAARRIADQEARRDRAAAEKAKYEAQLAQHEAEAKRRREAEKEVGQQLEAAVREEKSRNDELAKAREAKAAPAEIKAAQSAVGKASNERRRLERRLAEERGHAERNENWTKTDRRNIEAREEQIRKAEAQLVESRKFQGDLREVAEKAPSRTMEARAENVALQKELRRKVELLREFAAQERMQREELFQPDFKPQDITVEDMSALDIVDAYERARELERRITESYKDIKAIELAMQVKTDFASAEHLTDVAQTDRREADSALLRSTPKTQREFDAQKQEQVETVQEAERMVDSTLAMLNAAVEIVRSGDALAQARPDEPVALQKFALELEPPPPDPSAPPPPEAAPPPVSETVQAASDRAFFAEQLRTAAAETAEKAKDLSDLMKAVDQALQDREHGEDVRERIREILASSQTRSPNPGDVPTLTDTDPGLVPGNVIDLSGESGVPARWVYLTSWYVMGPFDNPNRVNLVRKFAPESTVDLDAAYVGRGGERVRWQFVQTDNNPDTRDWSGARGRRQSMLQPPGDPPYTIWYGYTEVFLDQECDLWLATGSDDRSDIWINDMHVWNSSNELKQWSINEGFRKVHFRKGRNSVLVRLENGWNSMGYSVCLYLGDSGAPLL